MVVSVTSFIGVMSLSEALKPVNAAFKLLFLLSAGGNAQARFTSCDFVVEFGPTQFGQPLLMIDDTAALAHTGRITGPLNVRNQASAIVILMATMVDDRPAAFCHQMGSGNLNE